MSRRHPFPWPDGRAAGCLITVDVDSVSPMISPVGQAWPRHFDEIEQREFGVREGVPRLLDILDQLALPATFFIPGVIAHQAPATVREVVGAGHEVGLHGYRHDSPRGWDAARLRLDLSRSQEALASAGAPTARGYRAPEWHVQTGDLAVLRDAGLRYDSSLSGFEVPYTVDGLLELPVNWGLDDAPFLLYTSRSHRPPDDATALADRWLADLDAFVAAGQLAVLTVHPWIIGRSTTIRAFARFCRAVRERDDVWTGTATQLADHTDALPAGTLSVVSTRDAGRWWS
jgi:peptidoglycan/xylan/chitin deacetylase (PgdA/CDA1 family)